MARPSIEVKSGDDVVPEWDSGERKEVREGLEIKEIGGRFDGNALSGAAKELQHEC